MGKVENKLGEVDKKEVGYKILNVDFDENVEVSVLQKCQWNYG